MSEKVTVHKCSQCNKEFDYMKSDYLWFCSTKCYAKYLVEYRAVSLPPKKRYVKKGLKSCIRE